MYKRDTLAIDLCSDGVFKAVFTRDTAESKAALTSLLSAFLNRPLSLLSVTANEIPLDDLRQRQIRYDINAKLEDGELVNIEVMVNPRPMEQIRMEYYLARLFVSQDIKGGGRSFQDLKRCWQLSIAAERPFFADTEWYHCFFYYDPERNISLDGGLNRIITIELTKTRIFLEKNAAEMTRLERWAAFFRCYADKTKQNLVADILALEEGIAMAEQVVQGFTESEIAYLQEMSRHKRETAYWDDMRLMEDARKKGWEEGQAAGLADGRAVEQLEIAKNALAEGLPLETIEKITGLGAGIITSLLAD